VGYIGGVSDVLPGTSRVRSILHIGFLVVVTCSCLPIK